MSEESENHEQDFWGGKKAKKKVIKASNAFPDLMACSAVLPQQPASCFLAHQRSLLSFLIYLSLSRQQSGKRRGGGGPRPLSLQSPLPALTVCLC